MMFNKRKRWLRSGVVVFLILAALAATAATAATAQPPKEGGQLTFATPDAAVGALIAAVRDDDNDKLTALFGPRAGELIVSGDPVADRNGRQRFLQAYAEKNYLEKEGERQAVLHIGARDYPFPIPLVGGDGNWFFDTMAGKEEILNRRIGRNELRVIEVLQAYTAAQRDYACRLRPDGDVAQFAQRLISSEGKRDGLYWPAEEGEEESPFGPLIAMAGAAGYESTPGLGAAEPFHGYYFKILAAQGEHAGGGPFTYLVNGKMVLGFGLVAYPADYGSTGVKTFIVNQAGVIHEKDLGEGTGAAAAMTIYDPDETWRKVAEPRGADLGAVTK
jgi:hypothetical protein